MELGTYRLAEINKGGGLRQKAQGTAEQYLNGVGTWTTFPTSLAPTAHSHKASEITSETLAIARIPTGITAETVALGNHTHLYAGSATAGGAATTALACTGNAATATKLATTRALTIGSTAKNFDGSQPVSWTLAEIGANQWQYGQYGTGSIKTNAATATGLRSGDEAKPYVYWSALAGQDLKAGGLAGADQKWMLISPMTVATYAYGGVEYTYNNATANYVFLLLIDYADFIGSATNPFNICRIIANAGTNYLVSYRTILTVGSPITGNVYPVIISTGSSTAPSGITYTESVSLYVPLKTNSTDYTGNRSVAAGYASVASGGYSIASGRYSVAAGGDAVASGQYSVAAGYASVASGYASVASGQSSVAAGRYSVASGGYSIASGINSVASGESQTVIGKYNVANTTSAFIIGNGTSTSARSNCMTVDFSGNMTLAGSVAIGASGDLTISKHAGADRLAYFDSAGTLQSSALYNLNSFAKADHNHDSAYSAIGHDHSGTYALATHTHDSTYLKLTGGTITGDFIIASGSRYWDYNTGWDSGKIPYFVSGQMVVGTITKDSFALASHSHALADLPKLEAGTLIMGTGSSTALGTLARGANGQFLSVVSNQLAWVAAPSGSTVSPANPTASVGLTAVNGSAATFMRSDAAPKLDVTIAPTWTGNHTFSGLTQLATVGIGVAPSSAYKLYIVEDKEITTAGSYIGNYLVAKYNTTLTSGTRQGIALLGQLWATGGTLTEAKGLDFKVYVPSGTVQEATAINAVIQTDGGSIGTAYGLKLSRLGNAPTVANYGVYQEDSTAENVFKGTVQFDGDVQFNGGTNLVTNGRARNIRFMTESGTIDHTSGTDTLIIVTSQYNAVLTLPTSATTGDRIEFYSTLATASFDCASAKIWPINNSSLKVATWGGGMGAPAYCFAIWDGTYWRVGYLSPGY